MRNQEGLLAAAVDVFRSGGPEASLKAVALCAEVGIGTLYRHFPTRGALFEAVYRREVEELARLAESLADGTDPAEALRQWSRAGIRLVATKRGMLTALALAADKSSDIYAFSFEHLTLAIGLLVGKAFLAGRIRDDVAPEDLLQVLVGMSMLSKGAGGEVPVIRLLDIFMDGLIKHEA